MKIEMNRFDDIEHMPLRVYNRAVSVFNMQEDFGKAAVGDYLKLFSQGEVKQIFLMLNYIQVKGAEQVKKFVTKGLDFEYDTNATSDES